MTTVRPLTQRQKEILGFMVSHCKIAYPTVREVAKHFGLSPSTTHRHIQALRKKAAFKEK